PINKIENSLVYCANAGDVDTVVCDGQVLMEGKHIAAFDEESWVSHAVAYAYDRFRADGIDLPAYFCLS
ncbi:MAG TPA: hypothetical protein VGA61_03210, partial [Anaerolineae bacterium]